MSHEPAGENPRSEHDSRKSGNEDGLPPRPLEITPKDTQPRSESSIPPNVSLVARSLVSSFMDPFNFPGEYMSRTDLMKHVSELEPDEIACVVSDLNNILLKSRIVQAQDDPFIDDRKSAKLANERAKDFEVQDHIPFIIAALGKVGQHAVPALPGLISHLGDPRYCFDILAILRTNSQEADNFRAPVFVLAVLTTNSQIKQEATDLLKETSPEIANYVDRAPHYSQYRQNLRSELGNTLGSLVYEYVRPKKALDNWNHGFSRLVEQHLGPDLQAPQSEPVLNLVLFASSFRAPCDEFKLLAVFDALQALGSSAAKATPFLEGFIENTSSPWLRFEATTAMIHIDPTFEDTGFELFRCGLLSEYAADAFYVDHQFRRMRADESVFMPRVLQMAEDLVPDIGCDRNLRPASYLISVMVEGCNDVQRTVSMLLKLRQRGKEFRQACDPELANIGRKMIEDNWRGSPGQNPKLYQQGKDLLSTTLNGATPVTDAIILESIKSGLDALDETRSSSNLGRGASQNLLRWLEQKLSALARRYNVSNLDGSEDRNYVQRHVDTYYPDPGTQNSIACYIPQVVALSRRVHKDLESSA
jgi:hypothetical protein